ncbi:Regulator of Vps4 activity in the MVB pathway protein [Zea mays]|uniref:Regulator of Vps4 activity in the MVB pathway protein n=1 Tax=Zea mays TaxID=4577 RepID=A0A1D6L541_MAIZE|nr:Regulator of Vps4 activity in the MVB pathway protein [Zea mays]|eukprot:XP_008665432.2 uncharacterized protein LOC103644022 [Zea mays]
MGFFQGKTSKQTARVKKLLGLALSRLAIARRPRLARRSIYRSDVGQLLSLGYLHRALLRAERVIEEDNMLQAFDIIELCCKRLVEHAAHLDKPRECGEEIREAAAGIMFAARWCGDLPELQVARTILEDKFGSDMAVIAKEGTSIVDPMLVWKLSGDKTNMELKKKVTKEIAVENSFMVDFSELQLQKCHTRISGHKDPGANIINRCAGTKSHTCDESWYRIECHIFTI